MKLCLKTVENQGIICKKILKVKKKNVMFVTDVVRTAPVERGKIHGNKRYFSMRKTRYEGYLGLAGRIGVTGCPDKGERGER